jgi:hypothetical protein
VKSFHNILKPTSHSYLPSKMVFKATVNIPCDAFDNYPAVLRMRDGKRNQQEKLKRRGDGIEKSIRATYEVVDNYPTLLRMREQRHPLDSWADDIDSPDGIRGADETMKRDEPNGPDEPENCIEHIAIVREEAREGVDQEVICAKRDTPTETLLREDVSQGQSGEMHTPTLQRCILTLMEQLHPLGVFLFAASWGRVRNYNAITNHCRTDDCTTIVPWESPLLEKQEQHREYEQLSPTDIFVNTLEKQTQEILLCLIPQIYCPVFYEVRATDQEFELLSREVHQQQVMLRSNETFFDMLLRKLSIGTPVVMFEHAVRGIRSMLSDDDITTDDEKIIEFDRKVKAESAASQEDSSVKNKSKTCNWLGSLSSISDDITMGDEKKIEFNMKLKPETTDSSEKYKSKACSWLKNLSSILEGFTACH